MMNSPLGTGAPGVAGQGLQVGFDGFALVVPVGE